MTGDRAGVVVMGGTSGIGLATARALGQQGARVTVTGRDESKLAAAVRELGGEADGQIVDATSREALRAFFQRRGAYDHLVLSVSGGRGAGRFRELDLAELRAGFEAKFWAQVQAAQAGLETLSPDGSITFITAISARSARPGASGLAAINGALEAMVPALAVELKPVRVNAVSPGVVDTPWWSRMPEEDRQRAFARSAEAAPVGRVGRPEDVAAAVVLLVGNTFMTGTVIECDGGLRLT